jgi:antitoxin PrlF
LRESGELTELRNDSILGEEQLSVPPKDCKSNEFPLPLSMATILEARANLTSQNQVTIPAPVRQALNLRGGKSAISFLIKSNGTVQVSRIRPSAMKEEDPALKPFLKLLEGDIQKHPERIVSIPSTLVKKAQRLVRKVQVDLDAPLAGE